MVELPGSYPFAEQELRAILFCDFDGTLTPRDIGLELLRHLGCGAELEERLRRGEISALEYYRRVMPHLPPDLTAERVAEAAHRIGLRPYVRELFDFCRQHGIGVAILSDGFDAYIVPLLVAAGMEMVPVACNLMRWDTGCPRFEFPWASESCQQNCPSRFPCAACKRAALLSWAPPQVPILYLGDGASDFCPALYADIVFARGELARWCHERGIGFLPYETLFHVRRALEDLLQQHRLSARYLPQQRRQRAWVEE